MALAAGGGNKDSASAGADAGSGDGAGCCVSTASGILVLTFAPQRKRFCFDIDGGVALKVLRCD